MSLGVGVAVVVVVVVPRPHLDHWMEKRIDQIELEVPCVRAGVKAPQRRPNLGSKLNDLHPVFGPSAACV